MPMSWFTGIVLYVLIWWITLFAVLPFDVKPIADADAVTGWRGAPQQPMIGRKVIATTLIAALLWGACYLVVTSGWISFRTGWLALPED
jgi:predicted secreted protein